MHSEGRIKRSRNKARHLAANQEPEYVAFANLFAQYKRAAYTAWIAAKLTSQESAEELIRLAITPRLNEEIAGNNL